MSPRQISVLGLLAFSIFYFFPSPPTINALNILHALLLNSGELLNGPKKNDLILINNRDYDCEEFNMSITQTQEGKNSKLSLNTLCLKYSFLSHSYSAPAKISIYTENLFLRHDFSINKKYNEKVRIKLKKEGKVIFVEEIS